MNSSRLPGAAIIFPISPYIEPPVCANGAASIAATVATLAARNSRRFIIMASFYG